MVYGEGRNNDGVTPTIENKNYQNEKMNTTKGGRKGGRGNGTCVVPDCTCTSALSCVDARRYGDSPVNRNRSYSLSSTTERSAVI